jgi:hypothetical protein
MTEFVRKFYCSFHFGTPRQLFLISVYLGLMEDAYMLLLFADRFDQSVVPPFDQLIKISTAAKRPLACFFVKKLTCIQQTLCYQP